MQSSRRHHHRPADESEHLLPSEGWLVAQIAFVVIFSSWDCGGMTAMAANWIGAAALCGIALLVLRFRETGRFNFRPFLPAVLWAAFCTIAICNPSHTATPAGWVSRAHWLRWLPTTVDRMHTVEDAQLWLPALVEAGLVLTLLQTRRAARLVWTILAVNGFILAAVGAGFHFARSEQVLGFIEPPEATYFFATFFYKNHWAAFGALAAIASLILALQSARRVVSGDISARGTALFFGGIGILTVVTLPLPGSRAGLGFGVAIVAAFVGGLFMTWRRRAASGVGHRISLALIVLMALAIVGYGIDTYRTRAAEDIARTTRDLAHEGSNLRVLVDKDTWQMAADRPVFGWGPGCFELIFPLYQGAYLRSPDGRATVRFQYAHNDWLQTLAEDGVAGFLLLVVPLIIVTWNQWRSANWIGHLAIAGCGLIALHAVIDFPLHNPAVLMSWVVMLASIRTLSPAARRSTAL